MFFENFLSNFFFSTFFPTFFNYLKKLIILFYIKYYHNFLICFFLRYFFRKINFSFVNDFMEKINKDDVELLRMSKDSIFDDDLFYINFIFIWILNLVSVEFKNFIKVLNFEIIFMLLFFFNLLNYIIWLSANKIFSWNFMSLSWIIN
jgi:hypothetical protein